MNVDPGAGRLAELVVHVVGLVQEQLQRETIVRPRHRHLPHLQTNISQMMTRVVTQPLCSHVDQS